MRTIIIDLHARRTDRFSDSSSVTLSSFVSVWYRDAPLMQSPMISSCFFVEPPISTYTIGPQSIQCYLFDSRNAARLQESAVGRIRRAWRRPSTRRACSIRSLLGVTEYREDRVADEFVDIPAIARDGVVIARM